MKIHTVVNGVVTVQSGRRNIALILFPSSDGAGDCVMSYTRRSLQGVQEESSRNSRDGGSIHVEIVLFLLFILLTGYTIKTESRNIQPTAFNYSYVGILFRYPS